MKIYNAVNIRKWDAHTIANEPIASVDLMERAATTCTKHILGSFYFESAAVFCGPGNNGGDGLVIARLFAERGINVKVFLLEFGVDKSEDFQANFVRLPDSIELITIDESKSVPEINSAIVIDAIFGSGLNRAIEGWLAEIVDGFNQLEVPIVAVDLPSGLFSDAPIPENGTAIKATKTISFQCPKMCFFFPENDEYIGQWQVIDIGLLDDFDADESATYVQSKQIRLKSKSRSDHKGTNGFLSVVAGIGGMPGAAILATKAAYRTGCGYVATTAANDASYSSLLASVPEALLIDGGGLKLPKKTHALLIGPGIGTSTKAQEWVQLALEIDLPAIWDADALNILARIPELQKQLNEDTILTPHIGELERLVGKQTDSLELLKAQMEFSLKHKVYIIQKGPNSKLTCPDGKVFINSTGNPGMASAGMGDVLSGMIGSLLAQGYEAKQAALYGMYFHGLSADLIAKRRGQHGIMSSDVAENIPEALSSF